MRHSTFFLILFLLCTIIPFGVSAESGDSSANPIVISLGTTSDSLPGSASDGSIWYEISFDEYDSYRFNLTTDSSVDFDLYLYNDTVDLIASSTDNNATKIIVEPSLFGTYLINIVPTSGSGSFDLVVEDMANGFGTAVTIGYGAYRLEHSLYSSTKNHFYNFSVTEETNLYFGSELDDYGQLGFFVYNETGTIIDSGTDTDTEITEAGNYTLRLFHDAGGGLFWLYLSEYGAAPWAAFDLDGSDLSGTYSGEFDGSVDSYWFATRYSTGHTEISLSTDTSGIDLYLTGGVNRSITGPKLEKSTIIHSKTDFVALMVEVRSNQLTSNFTVKQTDLGHSPSTGVPLKVGDNFGKHIVDFSYYFDFTVDYLSSYEFTAFTNVTSSYTYDLTLYDESFSHVQSTDYGSETMTVTGLNGSYTLCVSGDTSLLFYINVTELGRSINQSLPASSQLTGALTADHDTLWFNTGLSTSTSYQLSYTSGNLTTLDLEFFNTSQHAVMTYSDLQFGDTIMINQTQVEYIRVSTTVTGFFTLHLGEIGYNSSFPYYLQNNTAVDVQFPLYDNKLLAWFKVNVSQAADVFVDLDFDVYSSYLTTVYYANLSVAAQYYHDHDLSFNISTTAPLYISLEVSVSIAATITVQVLSPDSTSTNTTTTSTVTTATTSSTTSSSSQTTTSPSTTSSSGASSTSSSDTSSSDTTSTDTDNVVVTDYILVTVLLQIMVLRLYRSRSSKS